MSSLPPTPSLPLPSLSPSRRSKTIALILSVLFGFLGGDWFYLSISAPMYITIGLVKMMLSVLFVVSFLMLVKKLSTTIITTYVLLITLLVWYITDIVRIVVGTFKDGLGQPLV